jgi:hypothetical protein
MATFDAVRAVDRLRAAGAEDPMAHAIAETIREAVEPLPTRDEVVTRSVLEAVLDAKLQAALHAQTRWMVMFALGLAAIVIAAVAGIVAALV